MNTNPRSRRARWFISAALATFVGIAGALDITVLPNDELQRRYEGLTHELRCMQCQNNTIADSPSMVADDLRREVKEMLIAGKTDAEIKQFMVDRYGNVILFDPPKTGSTAWIWITPGVLIIAGVFACVRIVRQRSALVATDDTTVEEDLSR
jgi:cytochrome c-type biogenesis protein CcmH